MTTTEIKIGLLRADIRSKDIAKQLGVSLTSVSLVLNGHAESRRIKTAIAEAIGLNFDDVWPKKEPRKTYTEIDHVFAASERAGLNLEAA